MQGVWREKGFNDFIGGQFGNAGHNIYVSRAGVLQRIHQFDLNSDGHFDLVFCNSQNHWERPPVYVYTDPLAGAERVELPSDGSWSAAVADLNGDGQDDLVVAMLYNGVRVDLNACIYYNSPEGFSERRTQLLPVPRSTSVAAGDFNGDGRMDLAFISEGRVRLFYQSSLGFEPKRYVDLPIKGEQLAAEDLDGDGFADLVIGAKDGETRVFWGGPGGIDPTRVSVAPVRSRAAKESMGASGEVVYADPLDDANPLSRVVRLGGVPHLFLAELQRVFLLPVHPDRSFGAALELPCAKAVSVAVGDINGDGYDDLAFACRDMDDDGECSWVYWGGPNGIRPENRTCLPSFSACDVVVGHLKDSRYGDVLICQSHNDGSYDTDSLVYRGGSQGVSANPIRLPCHGARRVLLTRSWKTGAQQVILVNKFSRNRLGNIPASIYFGGADGFTPERRQDIPAWGAIGAICCDINDDGRPDMVVANASENSPALDPGSYILLNEGKGFPDKPSLRIPSVRAHGVCCADINRDGYLDLIFSGFRNPDITIFYGNAGGFDMEHPHRIRLEHEGVLYSEPRWIYLADLNNDGWLDLVIPMIINDRSFILWGGPEGFSMERCQVLSVERAACVQAADLTGNGYLDLIMGGHAPTRGQPHDSFAFIYWNGPEGLREDRRTLLPASAINSMAVADFNNDGMLDLFVTSYHDGKIRDIDSYLYWNRRGRGFSASDRTRIFTHSASGCVAADFNEDGWMDLAVAYHKVNGDHLGHSAVWWNGPDGFSEARVTRLPTSGPHGMTCVNPGSILDRGPEEYYTSKPGRLPPGARITRMEWKADVPAKTWVKAQLRSAASSEMLAAAPWQGPGGESTWFDNGQAAGNLQTRGPWVQYRLVLGALNSLGTPRVSEVGVCYVT